MAESLERLRAALGERYAVERELGRGGMAVVYLAQDRKHHRPVAIKVLRSEIAALLGRERFLREIETAAQLTHPHILPLHDSGDAEGCLYYVMPYVAGESLRERLDRERQLPIDVALGVAREVADALSYAHARDVLHRDIKPENILLVADHAVVSDFGIARAMSAAGGDRLTETGIALGTPIYMSPEQCAADRELDARSDVYSLGCVLYEMLAGEPPFTGPTAQAVIAKRLSQPVPALRCVRDQVPSQIECVVLKALARTPADRFRTAGEFARALHDQAAAAGRLRRGVRLETAGKIALGGLAVLGAVWATRALFSGPGKAVSATRVAVLPFSVSGSPTIDYLDEGMADLLSRNLDGAEDLRTIDPSTVLTMASKAGGTLDTEGGRSMARRLGAGLYVLGSVHAVGPRLRLQARLYGGASPAPEAEAQAAVEGDTTQLFELVDRLSAELLVRRGSSPVFQQTRTAARTTRSLPALKEYLSAERDLRAGKVDAAIAGFQRAVAEDSAFAVAHYRLAIAAGWAISAGRAGLADLSRTATARALAMNKRLSERERRLLEAYGAFLRGAANDAEREYRAILGDYHDDLEAEFLLADLLYHYNPLRGRYRSEAREPFDRVLGLDPGFG